MVEPIEMDYSGLLEEMEEETDAWKRAIPNWSYTLRSEYHWDKDNRDDPNESTKNDFFQGVVEGFEGKRIFVCCDGTGQDASGTFSPMTNVAKISRAIDRIGRDDYGKPPNKERQGFVRQIVYYSPGIGTQSSLPIDRGFSMVTGKGLNNNILSAYCFLCNNYNFSSCADEIILVGFSRGAFTVRCLAHFISTVGLLRRKGLQFLRILFSAWKKWGNATGDMKNQYKEQLDKKLNALGEMLFDEVSIKVLAEWDTVSALGLPLGFWKEQYSFVNEHVPAKVENAFFALALDEKRPKFKPRQWSAKENENTRVQQCAFVGCHSDVGGGVPDMTLSTVSLLWMVSRIEEVSKAKFDKSVLLQFMTANRAPTAWFGGNHRAPADEEGEDTDAESSAYDETREAGEQARLINGHTRQNWRIFPKSIIQLKNFAASEGVLHKSRTGWWAILYFITFKRWHGKREKLLYSEIDEFKLKVHSTAGLVATRLKCQLLKTHKYEDGRWTNIGDSTRSLEEDQIGEREWKLLDKWKEGVEDFRPREALDGNDRNLDDGDIDWTELAEGMGWIPPRGDVPEDALILTIANRFQRTPADPATE